MGYIFSFLLLISVAGIVYPFWPFRKRRYAALVSFALFMIIGLFGTNKDESATDTRSEGPEAASEAQDDLTVPVEGSKSVPDNKQTEPTQIRTVSEQGSEKTEVALKTFSEADFYWDDLTTPWKAIIIEGVNRVHHDNPRCTVIDPSSAYPSMNMGTKSDPVFYVTCGKGVEVFNYFFSRSEVESGKAFGPTPHLRRTTAVEFCEDAAKQYAKNPGTVEFSKFIDLGVHEYPNGRTRVRSTFAAENQVGMKAKFNIDCLMDIGGIVDVVVEQTNQ